MATYMLFDMSAAVDATLHVDLSAGVYAEEVERDAVPLSAAPTNNYLKFEMNKAAFMECISMDLCAQTWTDGSVNVLDSSANQDNDDDVFKFNWADRIGGVNPTLVDVSFDDIELDFTMAFTNYFVAHNNTHSQHGGALSTQDFRLAVGAQGGTTTEAKWALGDRTTTSTSVHNDSAVTAYAELNDNALAYAEISFAPVTMPSAPITDDLSGHNDILHASTTIFDSSTIDISASITNVAIDSRTLRLYLNQLLDLSGDMAHYNDDAALRTALVNSTDFTGVVSNQTVELLPNVSVLVDGQFSKEHFSSDLVQPGYSSPPEYGFDTSSTTKQDLTPYIDLLQ